jgi:hypothetical protein
MRKLDAFNHFFPARYYQAMVEMAPDHKDMGSERAVCPCCTISRAASA